MATITTILWDVGGVLLTNGWDHKERAAVLSRFGVDWDAFEQRHPDANDAWEKGLITVEEYLQETVFYEPRKFTVEEFVDAMKAQSKVLEDSALGILGKLALDVFKRNPQEIAFVDDRAGNVEAAKAAGMHGIRYEGSDSLKREFEALGIKL
jgi:putative hydrolase of the HAD superfamily